MDDPNATEWRLNLQGKAEEVQKCITVCLTSLPQAATSNGPFQNACMALVRQVAEMRRLYSTNGAPPILNELHQIGSNWPNQPTDLGSLSSMLSARGRIIDVGNGRSGWKPFEQIFQEKAKDKELTQYLASLCADLRKLLAEGEDEIATSMARELKSILEEIERMQGKSLVELSPWLEFLIVSLGAAAGDVTNHATLFPILVNAFSLTLKSRRRIGELYDSARKALVEDRQFRYAVRILDSPSVISNLDALKTEKEIQSYLMDSSHHRKALPAATSSDPR